MTKQFNNNMECGEREERSLQFVAEHYRKGSFDAKRDWLALGLGRTSWLRRNIAAAAFWGVALVACAGLATWALIPKDSTEKSQVETVEAPATQPVAPQKISHRIEFTDATLEEVVAAVNEIYGVTLTNLPETNQRFTLSYEGTAEDFVQTLNSLLGSSIAIENADGKSSDSIQTDK